MEIRIHPAAREAEYTELLLTLLAQASGLTDGLEQPDRVEERPA